MAADRSLQLTEQHIDQVRLVVGMGWLATLVLVAGAALLAEFAATMASLAQYQSVFDTN